MSKERSVQRLQMTRFKTTYRKKYKKAFKKRLKMLKILIRYKSRVVIIISM